MKKKKVIIDKRMRKIEKKRISYFLKAFDYNLTIVYYDEKQVKMLEIKWRKKHDC